MSRALDLRRWLTSAWWTRVSTETEVAALERSAQSARLYAEELDRELRKKQVELDIARNVADLERRRCTRAERSVDRALQKLKEHKRRDGDAWRMHEAEAQRLLERNAALLQAVRRVRAVLNADVEGAMYLRASAAQAIGEALRTVGE